MRKITLLLLIGTLFGCQSKKNRIENYFSKEKQLAIRELNKQFKNEICKSNYEEKIFRTEIEKIKTSIIDGDGEYTGLDYENISQITDRLNSIYNLNIFTKECKAFDKETRKSTKYYCISPKSNFRKFLNKNKDLKKSWTYLDDELSTIGVLSSNSVRYLLSDKGEIDIDSDSEILVLAVTLMQNVFQREGVKQSEK